MEYPVIVEQENGVWRAIIPALSDLSAEGYSYDEAVHNARRAAEAFLSKVQVTTIEVSISPGGSRLGSPQAVLKAAGQFKGDPDLMQQHLEEIYAARRRQDDEAERNVDLPEPD